MQDASLKELLQGRESVNEDLRNAYEQKQAHDDVKLRHKETEKEVNDLAGEEDDNVCSNSDKEDPDYIPYPEKQKPKKLLKQMLELPTKDLMQDISVLVARLRLSNRAATSLVARIILSAGGDVRDFVLSKSEFSGILQLLVIRLPNP